MSDLLFFLPDTDLIQAEPSEHFSDPEPLPRIGKNLMKYKIDKKARILRFTNHMKSNKIE